MRSMVAGAALPTRRTRRVRGSSWMLSRLTADCLRTPSAALSSTSVDTPRPVGARAALLLRPLAVPIGVVRKVNPIRPELSQINLLIRGRDLRIRLDVSAQPGSPNQLRECDVNSGGGRTHPKPRAGLVELAAIDSDCRLLLRHTIYTTIRWYR